MSAELATMIEKFTGTIETAEKAEKPERVIKGGRILVVDDENGPRQALRILLKEEHDVHLAQSVFEAEEILERETIDLVITDLRMPKRTGVDLLRAVKTKYPDKPQAHGVPFTGLSNARPETKALANQPKALDYLPFDYKELLEKQYPWDGVDPGVGQ